MRLHLAAACGLVPLGAITAPPAVAAMDAGCGPSDVTCCRAYERGASLVACVAAGNHGDAYRDACMLLAADDGSLPWRDCDRDGHVGLR